MAGNKAKEFFRKNKINLIVAVIIGLVSSFPYVGFVYGFFHCEGCNWGLSGIFERLFVGMVEALNAVVSLGHLYADEAGHLGTNLRLYILPVFIIFTTVAFLILRKKIK